jgi:hypothetical protein
MNIEGISTLVADGGSGLGEVTASEVPRPGASMPIPRYITESKR